MFQQCRRLGNRASQCSTKPENCTGKCCPILHIDNTSYRLLAVMHFVVQSNHFVAYTRHNDNSWKCLDDLKKTEQKVEASTEVSPFLVCYVATIRKIDFENLIESKVNMITILKITFCKKNLSRSQFSVLP